MKEQVKLRDFTDIDYKDVHDIVFPADVRETDLIRAKIRISGSDDADAEVRVWKLSPLGIELLVDSPSIYSKGDSVSLAIRVGRQTTKFEGLVVEIADHTREGKLLLGVRIHKRQADRLVETNRRSSTRWVCSSQFYPVAIAANPIQFNDFVYITVRDISSGGMRALTSLRNKFLVPGMTLDWQISFPLTGHAILKTKVSRATLTADNGKDYLELGMEFVDLSRNDRELIGQYLVQFSDADSLEEIRNEGFYPVSLTKGIDYSYIKNEADFREVLELRLIANRQVEKIPGEYTAEDMADIFDSRSRIIVGRHKGRIVGTARITLVEANENLETEQFIALPDYFPRRDQIVECSRAATHPEYRRGDLLYSLIQHLAITSLQAKRHFALLSTTEELAPMYMALGFQRADLTYSHPLYPSKTQHVLFLNIPNALSGSNVNAVVWNVVWRRVLDYVNEQNLWPERISNTRTKLYRIIDPISNLMLRVQKRLKRR